MNTLVGLTTSGRVWRNYHRDDAAIQRYGLHYASGRSLATHKMDLKIHNVATAAHNLILKDPKGMRALGIGPNQLEACQEPEAHVLVEGEPGDHLHEGVLRLWQDTPFGAALKWPNAGPRMNAKNTRTCETE